MSDDGASNKVNVRYKKIRNDDLKYDDKFLERGTYGDVRKATWHKKSVAVKMFSCAERKGGFSEELVCLSMLHEHENIVNLHGAHIGDSHTDRPFLVLEFAPYSLEKVLHQCRAELKYTVENVMSWSVQMAIALAFIHGKDMLHRDIKPSNILLFQEGKILKLCDFGTARKLENTLTNAVGTSWYMAPEVIRGTCYTASCDVYSFGVVLWEMITRHKPYLKGTQGKMIAPQSVLYRVAMGERPPMIAGLPKCLEELINKCWGDTQDRPTTLEVKNKLMRLAKMMKMEGRRPFIHSRNLKKTEQEKEPVKEPLLSNKSSSVTESNPTTASTASISSTSPSPSPTSQAPPPPPPSQPSSSSSSQAPPPQTIPHTSQATAPPSRITPSLSTSSSTSSVSTPPPPPPPHPPHRPRSIATSSSTPKLRHLSSTSTASSRESLSQGQNLTSGVHNFSSNALTKSERNYQLYKQQSSPAGEGRGGHLPPEALPSGDQLSSSYPHGQLSPFTDRRRLGGGGAAQTPSTAGSQTPGQFTNSSPFSPPTLTTPISHQDSNMFATTIEREGDEEDEVSQKQRQQWFQKVQEKSQSGEWDDGTDSSEMFCIPGLEDQWQPVIPDTKNSESLHLYEKYKEVAQLLLRTNTEINHLTDIRAKLDQEIARDKKHLENTKSTKEDYQALLNKKDAMVNELQGIKRQLN